MSKRNELTSTHTVPERNGATNEVAAAASIDLTAVLGLHGHDGKPLKPVMGIFGYSKTEGFILIADTVDDAFYLSEQDAIRPGICFKGTPEELGSIRYFDLRIFDRDMFDCHPALAEGYEMFAEVKRG